MFKSCENTLKKLVEFLGLVFFQTMTNILYLLSSSFNHDTIKTCMTFFFSITTTINLIKHLHGKQKQKLWKKAFESSQTKESREEIEWNWHLAPTNKSDYVHLFFPNVYNGEKAFVFGVYIFFQLLTHISLTNLKSRARSLGVAFNNTISTHDSLAKNVKWSARLVDLWRHVSLAATSHRA